MVAQWSIKRRKMTQANVENLFEIRGKCMERHGLVKNWKRSLAMENGKIEEKRLETDEFVEDSRNSRKTREKLQFRDQKLKNNVQISEK